MPVDDPEVGMSVCVTARPHLVGTIVEIVSATYVRVEFDNVPDIVGVGIDRLSLA